MALCTGVDPFSVSCYGRHDYELRVPEKHYGECWSYYDSPPQKHSDGVESIGNIACDLAKLSTAYIEARQKLSVTRSASASCGVLKTSDWPCPTCSK